MHLQDASRGSAGMGLSHNPARPGSEALSAGSGRRLADAAQTVDYPAPTKHLALRAQHAKKAVPSSCSCC